MSINTKEKMSFDQFLFDQFKIKENKTSVLKTDSFVNKTSKSKVKRLKTKNKSLKRTVSTQAKTDFVFAKDSISETDEKENFGLAEVLKSMTDKDKMEKVTDFIHQHESEWYHAFRDLKEEIVLELSKKHPNHKGVLKFKSEIKEFWEQFDEYIERFVLELEKIFQNFPNMSRAVVIYLLAIVISLPLVFFSFHQNQKPISRSVLENKIDTAQKEVIKFTDKMKSDYVARHSAEILASGKKIIQVTKRAELGRVAGAYENKTTRLTKDKLGQKIFGYYHYLSELKDEFIYNFKKKIKL